jgi:D-threo-aldose 1-dehydrogenase
MDPVALRPLGRTSLRITPFGFGAGPVGGVRVTIPEREAISVVEGAYDSGVRLFDTSPFYGYGRSELRVGAALRDKPRDGFVLSTKIGRWMRPLKRGEDTSGLRPNSLPFVPTFDYSYDGIHRSLEQSLLRLGMDRVDILLIHDIDFWTTRDRAVLDERFRQAMEGGYRALDDLRRAGTIGAIGIGLNESDTASRFVRAGDFDCVLLAGRYTLLEQGALDEFLPLCGERNVAVIIGGPFNSGILATGASTGTSYNYGEPPHDVMSRVARIEAVCRRHDVPIAAAALQFPLAHRCVAATIPGAASAAELATNLALFRRPIPTALWQELHADALLDARAPVPG